MHNRPTQSSLMTIAVAVAASLLFASAASALQVTAVGPTQNGVNVPTATSISLALDAAIDPATVDSAAILVRGNMTGLHPGTITVAGNQITYVPAEDFACGELVSVVAKRAVKTMLGDSLTNGYFWSFTVAASAGTGRLHVDSIYPGESVPYYIYGGDLDGDGDMDIATPNEGSENVSIYFNEGDGTLGPLTEYATGTISSSVYGDDFDNDGDLDLAVANKLSNDVSVLLNNGDGSYGPQTLYPAGSGTQQIYGGDIDNDGDIDLVTSQTTTNDLRVFFNAGNGTFDSLIAHTWVDADPNGIFGGDFNGDGTFDVAAANFGFATMTVVLGAGDGTFVTGPTVSIGSSTMMYGGDLNADGHLDIVATNNPLARTAFLFNDGNAGFTMSSTKPAGNWPLAAWCGDLDADGDLDAMVSNFGSADLSVYFNDGAGVFTDQVRYNVSLSGSFVWFHDLDGDGDLDVSAVDELADFLYVFENCPCADFAASPSAGQAPLNVGFVDTSPDTATGWTWSFGDGDSSMVEAPSHSYGPGVFDVELTITTTDGTDSKRQRQLVTVWADTLSLDDLTVIADTAGFWEIRGTNAVPISEYILPVSLSNVPEVLFFDSLSTVGCRTGYFELQDLLFDDHFGGQLVLRLRADNGGGSVPLAPGSGPIARIYYRTNATASSGDSSVVSFDPLSSHDLEATTLTTSFMPEAGTAVLRIDNPNCLCPAQGDVAPLGPGGDGLVNVLDVVAIIDFVFRSGPALPTDEPVCPNPRADLAPEAGCGDAIIDVLDVVAVIDHVFRSGGPICDPCR